MKCEVPMAEIDGNISYQIILHALIPLHAVIGF